MVCFCNTSRYLTSLSLQRLWFVFVTPLDILLSRFISLFRLFRFGFRSYVKVEVAGLGSWSLIVLNVVSVDVKQHELELLLQS